MGTASALIDQAIRRLNELSTTAPVRWTRAELLVYLNDGLAELNLIAADYQTTVSLTVNNTSAIWDVPSGNIGVLSVRSPYGYLLRQTIEDMDKEADWEDLSIGRLKIRCFAPLGLYKIVIHPVPFASTVLSPEVLTEYDPVTDAAVDLSGWIRLEYEGCLIDFIVSRAMFKEGGAEFAQSVTLYNRFLEIVQQLSGRNIIRREPAWEIQPESKPSEKTIRGE